MLKKLRERLNGDYITEPRHDIVIYDILVRDGFIPVTLVMSLTLSCAIIIIRSLSGLSPLALSNLVYITFYTLLFILYRVFPKQRFFRSVIFMSLIITMIHSITGTDPGFGEFILVLIFPVITYNLAGKTTGTVWNIVFATCFITIISLSGTGRINSAYPVISLVMAFLLFLCLTIFSYYAEIRHSSIERLLLKQLYYDSISGLPNRKMLMEDMQMMIYPVVFILRIDNFHDIHTFFGYTLGDNLMKFIGGRISLFEETHSIKSYNLSGGEFALLLDMDNTDPQLNHKLSSTAQEVLRHITNEEFIHESNRIPLNAYIGIARYTDETEHLISRADMALHHAIDMKLPFHIYTDHDNDRIKYILNITTLSELNSAITADRIVPYFQPILNNHTGIIEKHEALLRVISPDNIPQAPGKFLNAAKKTRVYNEITKIMIRKVFAFMENDTRDFSINITASDIHAPEFPGFLEIMMEQHPANRGRVILEIVESEGFDSYQTVGDFIRSAREKGYRFAIDDFGSGFSNFSHLSKLNIDYIKFDGSLIRRIDTDNTKMVIVRNVAELCRELGILTIAEFVETEEVFNRVKEFGIDYSQGFYIGLPGPLTHGV
ncbi:MAG TPA: GGDEF domain-containing protein [Spirochaetota bacterium]|nr:GGDEF domain-containing protein [Spirochaetota bacterium]